MIMSTQFRNNLLATTAAALLVLAACAPAHAQQVRPMAELLTTLKDPGLTSVRKSSLVGQTFSGQIIVSDVRRCSPSAPCKMEIVVNLGTGNPLPFQLVFATNDARVAERLRKGETASLRGKLVRFLDFPRGQPSPFEQVMFEQAVVMQSKSER